MNKMAAIATVVLLGVFGWAQAEDGTGWGYIEDYYKSIPKGNPETLMMLRAWGCHGEVFYVMMGADFNGKGVAYEDVAESMGLNEEMKAFLKEGFSYKDTLDPRISQQFAKCLVDAHKDIGK